MTERTIEVAGCEVNVHNFGYGTYLYPSFNGNAEFRASHKGFRDLSHYLRMIKYWTARYKEIGIL